MFYPSADFSLGLSYAANSHKPPGVTKNQGFAPRQRKRNGQDGISGRGKRMVKSACTILEKKYGKDTLTFGTATLPSLTPEECQLVTIVWAELTRQFQQEVKRLLIRRGLSAQFVYVVEIQEKRWYGRGELAPHLHWVCQGRCDRKDNWRIRPIEIREIWQRLVSSIALGRSVDCSAATRIERVKKSAARYLSKYMSKGGKVLESIKEAGLGCILPTSWWGMTQELRREVLDSLICPTPEVKQYVIANRKQLKEAGLIRWYYDIFIDAADNFKALVGVVGSFANEAAMWKVIEIALANQ